MKFIEACESYFGSKDLYEILNISRDSSESDVRKAYYRLSLSCHPDRVPEDNKSEATEKFKVLGKIHAILSDPEKRAIYNETGVWTEEDDDENKFEAKNWMEYWRLLFKKVTLNDIQKFENDYKGSEEELADLQKIYLKCKGDMDKMFQHVLFATYDDEDRIRCILMKLIEDQVLPGFDIFVNEPQVKRDRRIRKLRKEAEEAEKESKKIKEREANDFGELQRAILARRQQGSDSFLEALEKKYAGPKMSGKTPKKSSRGKGKK